MLPAPLAIIAELTHRCPLHCVYCSNPLEMRSASSELTTQDWMRVFQEAAQLGVLHVHLTGGEPAARQDLEELVATAHASGLYTNLITSGIGLPKDRLRALVDAGLEHIQLSFQDSRDESANTLAGTRSHARKLELARQIREFPVAFTVNVVVHRQNLDHLEEIIVLAEELGPDRLEIANVQYYGWGLLNRDRLLPTHQQLERSQKIVATAAERLNGRMRIEHVSPDYYAKYPKACMGGWGRRIMLIDPAGRALPCHAANVIPDMQFDNVRHRPLRWIWQESSSFQRFRGEGWMPEPCCSCERRTEDFGGCRCQAMLLAGDASATDPVCSLSPQHSVVENIVARTNSGKSSALPVVSSSEVPVSESWIYRPNPQV